VVHLRIRAEKTEAIIKAVLHLVGFAYAGRCRAPLVASEGVP
jgi:dihydrodipicolinate synthase/N-acetylneuraminate lyase